MNRKRISRIGKYVLVTMLLTAVPASGWAQRMIKVSGTVYNIADKKKKVPFSGSVVYVYSCKTVAAVAGTSLLSWYSAKPTIPMHTAHRGCTNIARWVSW